MRGPTLVTAISNAGRSQDRTRLLVRAFASLPSVPCITAPARSRWAAPSLAVHSGDAPENVKHFVRKIRSRVDLLTLPEGGTCPIRTIGARSLRLKERTSAQEWDHALPEAFDDDFLRRRAGVAERGPGRPDAGCPRPTKRLREPRHHGCAQRSFHRWRVLIRSRGGLGSRDGTVSVQRRHRATDAHRVLEAHS